MDKEKVGAFIRERRREQNLTQKELADKLHITDKAVSKWERGISFPDITILEKLSELLKVSLFELMCGEKAAQEETDKNQIEVVLTETVQEAHRKTSSQKRKFRTILCAVMLMFAGVLIFLYCAREIINERLDTWAENADMPYHGCKFSVSYVPQAWEEIEGFYMA